MSLSFSLTMRGCYRVSPSAAQPLSIGWDSGPFSLVNPCCTQLDSLWLFAFAFVSLLFGCAVRICRVSRRRCSVYIYLALEHFKLSATKTEHIFYVYFVEAFRWPFFSIAMSKVFGVLLLFGYLLTLISTWCFSFTSYYKWSRSWTLYSAYISHKIDFGSWVVFRKMIANVRVCSSLALE